MRKQTIFKDLEHRIDNLTERAVNRGRLEERKEIADYLYEQYQMAFVSDMAEANRIYAMIEWVTNR